MYICKPYMIYCDFENKHILILISQSGGRCSGGKSEVNV